MESSSPVGARLHDLSAELILEIMRHMSATDISKFAICCRWLLNIFNGQKHIVMTRLLRSLPEFNSLLYICTSEKAELHPARMLYPRIIDLKAGPHTINLMQPTVAPAKSPDGHTPVIPTITLKMADIETLWFHAKVIDWWVETYPRLHWREEPENRRCLRAGEEVRLRKTIGYWWLYAHFHHGSVYSYRNFQQPKRWEQDTRMHHFRVMSTVEMFEVADLWRVVEETVSKDLCSTPERVCLCENGYSVDLVPWGVDEGRHTKIVKTYMKLNPEQLRYFLTYYQNRKKHFTIPMVSEAIREFDRDTETLSVSVGKAIQERVVLKIQDKLNILLPRIGLMDEDRKFNEDNSWNNDAWPGGRIPVNPEDLKFYERDPSEMVLRGDDGKDIPHPW
ncbi:uncharacterized protein F4822DRAFT_429056 [Hypoxylon trugodes]|uniref:uncharacterized protein n=1 Tax=Hypoxylon trugodes TaxID=326681 RepID=UPI002194FE6A|nr:uncharacterized protein F4822DRAFT_429056 [Hypoxylon trugodes]KAI1388430.1 hypothetical protein F4822DRAFT_429056 [Hypoxylon trugodes]